VSEIEVICMSENNARGFGLIGLLVVALIIAAIAVYMVPKYIGESGSVKNRIDTPIKRAESVDCMNNLAQIRSAVTMYRAENEQYPASLNALAQYMKGGSVACPVSRQPYNYDPSDGRVSCATPGHEGY